MPQLLSAVYVHLVFSTKERRRFLRDPDRVESSRIDPFPSRQAAPQRYQSWSLGAFRGLHVFGPNTAQRPPAPGGSGLTLSPLDFRRRVRSVAGLSRMSTKSSQTPPRRSEVFGPRECLTVYRTQRLRHFLFTVPSISSSIAWLLFRITSSFITATTRSISLMPSSLLPICPSWKSILRI